MLPPNTQIQANAILALTKSATVFISHLANAYVSITPDFLPQVSASYLTGTTSSANDFTVGSNKKTINPADVFKALDEIEYGFMRERLEAEFASTHPSPPPFEPQLTNPFPPNQNSTKSKPPNAPPTAKKSPPPKKPPAAAAAAAAAALTQPTSP